MFFGPDENIVELRKTRPKNVTRFSFLEEMRLNCEHESRYAIKTRATAVKRWQKREIIIKGDEFISKYGEISSTSHYRTIIYY